MYLLYYIYLIFLVSEIKKANKREYELSYKITYLKHQLPKDVYTYSQRFGKISQKSTKNVHSTPVNDFKRHINTIF